MGGCVSHNRHNRSHRRRRSRSSRNSATTGGTVGRNKPLNRTACRPKWKSDVPITENQLRRKREEYWDTAPAFEGRKEIWDALRGACYALEQNDIDLAQSIINCANISLPHGTLLDCYDELGTRYQLPIYVLSSPTNIIDGDQSSIDSRGDNESGTSDIGLALTAATDRERDYGGNQSSSSSSTTTITNNHYRTTTKSSTTTHHNGHNPIVREIKKHRRKQKLNITNIDSGNDSSSTNTTTTPPPITNQQQTNIDHDTEIPIKFRLSNGKEHRLYCKQNEKIRNIKRRLAMLENGVIDSQIQRLYFGGKLLRDRSVIWEARLQRNFVVQVILTDKPMSPNGAITTTGHLTMANDDKDHSNSIPVELTNTS
ncbi:unnamed protein product [Rotaria sordida]|uniref:Ubiquitin-like domain-containing protein n=1 Tax=Rotaria sordida TaxID=392033 RepID=A0A818TIE9_9BILA|nr:unnamed protein product [Rotaria sordida]CAF0932041.1 unnamed protein product [Rotaria sordida]CAF1120710.1 unnamed protein product [Rotaria sordida]CAF3633568.1 unnamed protein product [Rotaria sordida]CAF3684212.1 unnamed protein product [Rotaria sordida]